ncbi:MAG: response regulator [Pseudomonadales bacterium]|nr:response regulator [Pseudomonadales bacterium]
MATILIVDDSPVEAHVLEEILKKDGHKAIKASSGEEGLAMAIDKKPNLIVMDIVMPGMNGFKATRKIHRNASTKDIPIIIVTTKSQDTDIEWGLSQGASDYMSKPVDSSSFRDKVNNLLEAAVG